MLRSFARGNIPSHLVLIGDSADVSGRHLLQAFAISDKTIPKKVHVLCFENPVEKMHSILNSNVSLYDCFSDILGWDAAPSNNDLQHIFRNSGLFGVVQEVVKNEESASIVLIDSLSPALFHFGLARCYRDLHSLIMWARSDGQKLHQIVCLVHEDLLPEREDAIKQLRHLAVSYIQHNPEIHSPGKFGIHITHRKPGGRILKQMEQYSIDEDGNIISEELKSTPVPVSSAVDPNTLVQNLTTFKLKLEPDEEQARSQLVLPYTRLHKEENKNGGKVFYEPDEADDWDEEDPDDDLDV